ncbi:MAG: helix-turn-helix domain-containing protein [Opitutales bacterium]
MKVVVKKEKNPLAEAFADSIATVDSQVEQRKLAVVEELLQFMKREGIKCSELAERMGVGPSRITKMLSGDENLTIDTLVRAGHAVGADLAQTFVPKGQKGHWASGQAIHKKDSFATGDERLTSS